MCSHVRISRLLCELPTCQPDVLNIVCPSASRSAHTLAPVSIPVATWLNTVGPANKISLLHCGVPIIAPKQIGEPTRRLQAEEHRAPRMFHATNNGAAADASERLASLVLVVQKNPAFPGIHNSHGTSRCGETRQCENSPVTHLRIS